MVKEIIINSSSGEDRIAITEDGKLAELFFESEQYERIIGDIYLGRVAKVIPGIKAAFIELGFKQDAFLHFSDVGEVSDDFKVLLGEQDSDIDDDDDDFIANPNLHISQNKKNELPKLERNQSILVQITKEPVGSKGVRVTSKIAIPGRYLVLLPFENKVSSSKQIIDLREKSRLKSAVRNYKNRISTEFGAIIRTVAENQDESSIIDDLESLLKTWKGVEKNVKNLKPPALVYKDLSMTTSVIRDQFRNEVARVVTDSKKLYKEITSYLESTSSALVNKVELYKDYESIFDAYEIEKEIHKTLDKRVQLKAGGHICIEYTEAMVAIDVNSGRYAKSKDQETNSLKINLEAAREIVRQLRLRDIGGIIVIDFIDLYDEKNKRKVYDELKKEFKKDRAKVTILPMSEFGIVQITRQRMRQTVLKSITESCSLCGGSGIVESSGNIITRIERWIKRYKLQTGKLSAPKLILKVNPQVYKRLKDGTISHITRLSFKHLVRIKLVDEPTLALQDFRFINSKDQQDLTKEFSH